MTDLMKKRLLPTLLFLLLLSLCLTFGAVAASEGNLTFWIEREVDVWDDDMEWWDWDTESCAVTVEPIPDRVYNGADAEPVPVIWLDGKKLTEGEDYDVSYRDNDEVGTAYVCVDFYSPYEGYIEIPFQILPIDASRATVGAIPDQPYDGWEIEPDITVRLNGVVLNPWYDYSLSWSNNIYPGKATVTVQFMGNYTGKVSASFSIVVAPVTGLSASSYGTRVSLKWNESQNASTYVIQRYNDAKKKYVKIKTTPYPYYSEVDDLSLPCNPCCKSKRYAVEGRRCEGERFIRPERDSGFFEKAE